MSEDVKTFSMEEVSNHNTPDDLWIVYNGQVYNVTGYLDEHPGGEEVILDCAGTDATEAFNDIGHSDDAHDILKNLYVGKLEGGVTFVQKGAMASGGSVDVAGLSTPIIAAGAVAVAAALYFYVL